MVETTENVLHNYVNWTYNISLCSITREGYTLSQIDPSTNLMKSMRTLMASGNRVEGNPAWSPHFDTPFFFEKLSMMAAIGGKETKSNTNVFQMSFSIIEPMGVTLLNRLLAEAREQGYETLATMRYAIKIEFLGYNDDGSQTGPIPDTVKIIPVTITSFDMKITSRGSEYSCQATIPSHGSAYGQALGVLPTKFAPIAATVGDVFLADIGVEVAPDKSKYPLQNTAKKTDDRVRSLTGALNAWHKEHFTKGLVKYADSIVFEIDPEIANASLSSEEEIEMAKRPMAEPGGKDVQNGDVTKLERSSAVRTLTFIEGTTIPEAIGMVIRHSRYVTDQVLDSYKKSNAPSLDQPKPVKWFRTIPREIIKDFDPSQNRYTTQLVYRVVPYEIHNTRNSSFPMSPGAKVSRTYEYIFTGKNRDVLNLDLTFNTAFYTTMNSNGANATANAAAKAKPLPADPGVALVNKEKTKVDAELTLTDTSPKGTNPQQFVVAPGTKSQGLTSDSPQAQQANSLQENTAGNGDMISIEMKIVGDPAFIKDDDALFWDMKTGQRTTPSSSIGMGQEVFIKVNFKAAEDYNSIGLATPGEGKYSVGIFSGLFKVITLVSDFNSGKFTQTISAVRVDVQEAIDVPESNGTQTRTSTTSNPDSAGSSTSQSSVPSVVRVETNQGTGTMSQYMQPDRSLSLNMTNDIIKDVTAIPSTTGKFEVPTKTMFSAPETPAVTEPSLYDIVSRRTPAELEAARRRANQEYIPPVDGTSGVSVNTSNTSIQPRENYPDVPNKTTTIAIATSDGTSPIVSQPYPTAEQHAAANNTGQFDNAPVATPDTSTSGAKFRPGIAWTAEDQAASGTV